MAEAWYRDFFHGAPLELWRHACPEEKTRADVDLLERELAPEVGAELLDVPCGNGRHAFELARRGYRVTGVDLADAFVDEARARARAENAAVEIVHADMRCLPAGRVFAGAYCLGNSWGYLDHRGNVEFVDAVAQALAPGAGFVLETGMAAESILPESEGRRWMEVAEMLLLVDNHYDATASRLDSTYTFVREGARESRTASYRIYTVAEIRRLLRQSGLRTRALYGPGGDAYEVGSPVLILVAEKTAG